MNLGIIGCGAIGSDVAKAADESAASIEATVFASNGMGSDHRVFVQAGVVATDIAVGGGAKIHAPSDVLFGNADHEAQVSLPYSVAVALLDGDAFLEQYEKALTVFTRAIYAMEEHMHRFHRLFTELQQITKEQ
jgi:2-methylcitrate dehydratase PrpD